MPGVPDPSHLGTREWTGSGPSGPHRHADPVNMARKTVLIHAFEHKKHVFRILREILVKPFLLNAQFFCYKTLDSDNSSVKYLENRINCIEHLALFHITLIEHFALFRFNKVEHFKPFTAKCTL
jgi:hypothetical protein